MRDPDLPPRYARLSDDDDLVIRPDDQRKRWQRDRDRLIYASAFRRLAGVTQVVAASEGAVFHNRLTHTLEVAQIARRLSEHLVSEQGEVAEAIELEPEIAEAAALAHDLGHPPFGHVAERKLARIIREEFDEGTSSATESFEGNAQSFRVVTRLARRFAVTPGLDLTRATLNGVLKYPWFRELEGRKAKKFGAFRTEEREFLFARLENRMDATNPATDDGHRSIEAEIMDWADDVAYAVHDVEDFYRAGLVPLDRVLTDQREQLALYERAKERWRREDPYPELRIDDGVPPAGQSDAQLRASIDRGFDEAWKEFLGLVFLLRRNSELTRPYAGELAQRAELRTATSWLVSRYVRQDVEDGMGPTLQAPAAGRVLLRDHRAEREIAILKELIWQYVIHNPALASQQEGKRRVIDELFHVYYKDACRNDPVMMPAGFREMRKQAMEESEAMNRPFEEKELISVRAATDVICSMTEQQAVAMYRRVTGHSIGSVLDVIVR